MKKLLFMLTMLTLILSLAAVDWQVALIDSYGDGWNGGSLTVMVNDTPVLTGLTIASGGGPQYHSFPVSNGDQITTTYTAGSWAIENYYAILDHSDEIVAESGGTWSNPGASIPNSIADAIVVSLPAGIVDNPSNFTATSTSSSAIGLSWNLNAVSNDVLVVFNTTNTFGTPESGSTYTEGNVLDGGGTVLYSGNDTSYNHRDLSSVTQYFYKAWSVDGSTIYSSGVTANATTMMPPVTVYPYSEDFDGAWTGSPAAPLGWTVVNANEDAYLWSQANTYISPTHSGSFAAHGMGNTDDYLITPLIDLTDVDARMKWWDKVEGANYPNNYKVLVSTTDTNIDSFTDELGDYTCTNTTWTEHTLNLSAYMGQSIYVAFYQYHSQATNWGFGIDDFLVEEIPAQPVFNVAPTSWDYGVLDIAGAGAAKVFTISNSGAGDMNISSISVTGDYYRVTDEPDTYPVVVTSATPINFTVSYAPTVAGEHAGTVTIMQDGVEHTVTLTGEGFTRPAGSTVQNPLVVTLPVEGYTGNTEAYGNDYLSTWVTPSSSYLNGYDFVAQFTLDVDSFLTGSVSGSWTGVLIVNQEPAPSPNQAAILASGTGSAGGAFSNVALQAGTYYALVSTYPSPNYTDFTLNLSAVAAPTEPEFAVSPEIKDFGSLALGATSAPQVFTITNVGGGTLVLDPAISIGGEHADQFTLIDTNEYPKNLGLNQSMTVSVTFNPTSAGEKQGTLIINDNLAGDKSFTITRSTKNGSKVENSVTLTGIGVDTTIYERDLPYAQNFDSVTVPDLPLGWSKIQSSTSTSAYVRTISTTTPYSNPNHAAMYNIYTADVLILTTPMIDARLNSLRMSYWAKRGGSAENLIIGTMSDPTDPATFTPLQTVALTDTYTQYFYDFGAYEGEDDYIAFKHAATATYRLVYLDNVIIELIPSDPVFAVTPELKVFANQQIGTESAAQQFTVTNTGPGILTINEVSVTGPDADQFILVDENAYGFDIGAEANENLIVSVKFAPTTVGDKTANLRIVDSLSKEEHLVPLSGNGFDATIYAPHVQNFSGTFPPAYWTRHDQRLTGSIATGNTGSQWGQDDWLNITSPVNKAAKINVYGTTRNGWFVTPPISIPDDGYELKFDLALLKWNQTPTGTAPDQTGTDDRFIVLIGNGSNWEAANIVREWNNSGSEYVYNGIAISGETVTIPLADYVGTKYIAFYAESTVSNADNDLMIDNFKIVPINTDAAPIVGGEADLTPPPVTPEGGGDPINPTVEITGLTGEGTVAVTAGYNPEDVTLPNVGLALTFSGTNFAGSTITINHGLGFMPAQIAYRVIPGGWILLLSNDPSVLTWDATTVSFTTAAKAAGDLQVVFPQQQNQTLPVELSSFTAVLTADMFVNIAWVAESETNHLGYNILRSQVKDLDTALMLNPAMINEGSAAGTQMSYIYTDKEVYNNNVYYYWLESVAIDGSVQYAGPLTITLGDPNYEPPTPEIPVRTALMSAYPNPFNPQTNLRYSLKEAGDVQIGVYNMKGQLIRSYSRSHNVPGYYSVVWDGKDSNGKLVSSGVYFYRMNSGSYSATRKMMLMK